MREAASSTWSGFILFQSKQCQKCITRKIVTRLMAVKVCEACVVKYDMPRLSTASFKTSEPAMAVRLISEPRIFPCTIEAFRCGPECGRMSVILTLDEDPAPASPEAAYNVARICCRSRHVLDAPSKQIEVTLTKGWSKLSGLSPMKCLGPVTRGGLNWHSF